MGMTVVEREELGRRLHLLRWHRFTLAEVEKRTGVPRSVISRWERAEGEEYPDLRRLDPVAAMYGVTVPELLDPHQDTRVWSKAAAQSLTA